MTEQLQAALDGIRERAKHGGPVTMQLGGDPRAKVWPAETWKVCDSQADVAPMLAALEAVVKQINHGPKCDLAKKIRRELTKHLGSP